MNDGSNFSWVAQVPVFGWICITLMVMATLFILSYVILRITKGKNINTPILTVTEKTQLQAETRELSDNQMRGAKDYLKHLQDLFMASADACFADKDMLEDDFLDLLFKYIIQDLLDQFRIDLVRNHITKKNEQELKEYTAAKSSIYYKRVSHFFNEYNRRIPRFDLTQIMSNISEKEFFDIYYKAYLNSKLLSSGY